MGIQWELWKIQGKTLERSGSAPCPMLKDLEQIWTQSELLKLFYDFHGVCGNIMNHLGIQSDDPMGDPRWGISEELPSGNLT